ncbi:dihydromonapterin reductase [Sansalvadorimonas sp. 2012CJ34-2]|uniref:Dihydromonapterin reductase n=1 Tax=Parendozoicomonas callyspongiae TaxID=2942213 RepID=A0ABT0PDN9_9GAMM|nr:dihydromonapterin reductase [Sansalvadorimonas sp. 2012CJ34-2]MCL6268867.1 dihydromonapterin reductase [Sansalvadorimonas sp. 2012CJ34-2]
MSSQKGTVLITGASRRLGLYNARRLLEAGYRVIATFRHHSSGIDELKQAGAVVLQSNLDETRSILNLIEQVKSITSDLRAIIHNASGWISDSDNPQDNEPLAHLFKLHMEAPWLINRSLYGLLKNYPETADIVHMTDYNALRGDEHYAAYAATKAGLESLTRSFARLYAPKVKVNAIAPYLIIMNDHDQLAAAENTLHIPPMGLEPGEDVIWQSLSYILHNPYVTGTTMPVDGGMSLR